MRNAILAGDYVTRLFIKQISSFFTHAAALVKMRKMKKMAFLY